jgi:hypothetical protein
VRRVLTADGWADVQDFEVKPSGVTVGGVSLGDSVAFTASGRRVLFPATAVLAVQTTADLEAEQAVRDAERARRDAEMAAREEARFAFVHYGGREQFGAQVGKQNGECATCHTPVSGMVHAHLDPDGLVRCPGCSVLKVRYGNQMPTTR